MQESKKSGAALVTKWADAKTAAAAKKKQIQDDYIARIKEIEQKYRHDIENVVHQEPSSDQESSDSDLSDIDEEELRELTIGLYGGDESTNQGFFKPTYVTAPFNSTNFQGHAVGRKDNSNQRTVEDKIKREEAKDAVQATGLQVSTDTDHPSPRLTECSDESDSTLQGEPDDEYQNGDVKTVEPIAPPNRPFTRSLAARASVEKSGNGVADEADPRKKPILRVKLTNKEVQTATPPTPVIEADQGVRILDEKINLGDQEPGSEVKEHMVKVSKTLQMGNQISDLLFQAQEMFIQSQRVADEFVEYARYIGDGDDRYDARSRFDRVLKRSIYEVGAVEWPSARKERKQSLGGGNEGKGGGSGRS